MQNRRYCPTVYVMCSCPSPTLWKCAIPPLTLHTSWAGPWPALIAHRCPGVSFERMGLGDGGVPPTPLSGFCKWRACGLICWLLHCGKGPQTDGWGPSPRALQPVTEHM